MIRAVKTIEKDEEILVSYKSNKVPGTYLNREASSLGPR
jgi:hypothetical protein